MGQELNSGGAKPAAERALCVDLDGTLVRTDLLHETLCCFLKRNPVSVTVIILLFGSMTTVCFENITIPAIPRTSRRIPSRKPARLF